METKRLTATFSLLIVIWMMSYSAIIAGTFIHEMTHIANAIQPHAITISFNGNGEATATEYFQDDSEVYATFNGTIVTVCLLMIGALALLVLFKYRGENEN